ncbi:hypothetical protein DUNSADRAFT_9516 [Dunaliella salina]|uniref:Encoded protein n=1 Tax=Dunaliella salina TaxID=3046 RepID=A0ABQ7GHA8_DUNSA|nr:hypothetical protein DUNSADRAFT_9516 [Dunaliella salina]|eukprot:KAF5833990.1 hypothetical protein DUNSADRAFT_9516 [Dunaliella salina]
MKEEYECEHESSVLSNVLLTSQMKFDEPLISCRHSCTCPALMIQVTTIRNDKSFMEGEMLIAGALFTKIAAHIW